MNSCNNPKNSLKLDFVLTELLSISNKNLIKKETYDGRICNAT